MNLYPTVGLEKYYVAWFGKQMMGWSSRIPLFRLYNAGLDISNMK
jgi:hypothetical protein